MTKKQKNKQLKSLILDFENCEETEIPAKAIYDFTIGHIQKQNEIRYDSFSNDNHNVSQDSVLEADYCQITIDKEQLAKIPTNYDELTKEKPSAEKHVLSFNDITWVSVKYTDDSVLDIAMPWTEEADDDTSNSLQNVVIITNAKVKPNMLFSKKTAEHLNKLDKFSGKELVQITIDNNLMK